jgi:hypothetical protein
MIECNHPGVYPNCKACPHTAKLDPAEFEKRQPVIASEGYIIRFDNLDAFATATAKLMYGSHDAKRPGTATK